MLFIKTILSAALLSSLTFASAATLTCTMKNPENGKKVFIKTALIAEAEVSSERLDAVDNSYGFYLYINEAKNESFNLSFMFFDDNDEVGSTDCLYDPKLGSKVFCSYLMTGNDDDVAFPFSCKVK